MRQFFDALRPSDITDALEEHKADFQLNPTKKKKSVLCDFGQLHYEMVSWKSVTKNDTKPKPVI